MAEDVARGYECDICTKPAWNSDGLGHGGGECHASPEGWRPPGKESICLSRTYTGLASARRARVAGLKLNVTVKV